MENYYIIQLKYYNISGKKVLEIRGLLCNDKKGNVPIDQIASTCKHRRPQDWIIESDRTIKRNIQDDNHGGNFTKPLCNCWQTQAKSQLHVSLLKLLGKVSNGFGSAVLGLDSDSFYTRKGEQ